MFDPHGNELSGERGTSAAFSGEGEKSSHIGTDLRLVCFCVASTVDGVGYAVVLLPLKTRLTKNSNHASH